jgi:hypothetical protein
MGKSKSPQPQQINPSQEFSKIIDVFRKKELPAYQKYITGEPLLQQQRTLAQQQYGELPGLLSNLQGAYEAGTGNVPMAEDWIKSNFLQSVPTQQLTGPLMQTYQDYLQPILQSGGALTGQLSRQASQDALKYAGLAGMANTDPALFSAALNRDVYRQQRYGTALNQALGLTQDVSGLDSAAVQRALLAGQGITQLDQQRQQNALNYALGRTGLIGSTMQDLGSALGTGISAFTQLLDPSSSAVSSAINFNANARQAAANAASNKNQSTTSGLLSLAGSVAIAY